MRPSSCAMELKNETLKALPVLFLRFEIRHVQIDAGQNICPAVFDVLAIKPQISIRISPLSLSVIFAS